MVNIWSQKRGRVLVLKLLPELRTDWYPDGDFLVYIAMRRPLIQYEQIAELSILLLFPIYQCFGKSKFQNEKSSLYYAGGDYCNESKMKVIISHNGYGWYCLVLTHKYVNESRKLGALVLEETVPPQINPRSKHYANQNHLFPWGF